MSPRLANDLVVLAVSLMMEMTLEMDFGVQSRKAVNINKWAKPLPNLDLPPCACLQKASKVKQIWAIWFTNVALALSTWHDLAVQYWQQIYGDSEARRDE